MKRNLFAELVEGMKALHEPKDGSGMPRKHSVMRKKKIEDQELAELANARLTDGSKPVRMTLDEL